MSLGTVNSLHCCMHKGGDFLFLCCGVLTDFLLLSSVLYFLATVVICKCGSYKTDTRFAQAHKLDCSKVVLQCLCYRLLCSIK